MDVIIHFLLAKKIPSWVQAASRLRDHVLHESYEETSSFISKKIPSWVQAASRLRDHVLHESYLRYITMISKLQIISTVSPSRANPHPHTHTPSHRLKINNDGLSA